MKKSWIFFLNCEFLIFILLGYIDIEKFHETTNKVDNDNLKLVSSWMQ